MGKNSSRSEELTVFFHVVKNDKRLTATHLSIYFVLYRYWVRNDSVNPVPITRRNILSLAKVSVATYHKRISELHNYGYITYVPSYNPATGSVVYLHFTNPPKP